MPALDTRKVRILQAIVSDYVTTTRPVGSDRLIEVYHLGCKSATVRNEMAEMVEMGYLVQPHTSAGRVPTDRGYRYYVDQLMHPPSALAPDEARNVHENSKQEHSEVTEIVLETCRILSGLTSYLSLATDPSTETATLVRIYLSQAGPRHLLLVALLSTGHVEHRLVEMETVPNDAVLVRLVNFLNAQIADHDLTEAAHTLTTQETPAELFPHSGVLMKVSAALGQVLLSLSEQRIFLEGMNHILRQPEFKDAGRIENLMNALEQQTALYRMLRQAMRSGDVTIIIGTENAFAPMQECSVITTTYFIGERPAGSLGVVGPTRMHYDRAAAAVGLMARNLSQVLTNLSLA